jgi:aminomethyltransferase
MALKTPLYDRHAELGARLVDFGGWDMPLNYGSQIEEHHAVRRTAGVFDVSHMRVVDIDGAESQAFLKRLLANDVGRLTRPGQALYSCMLNERAGVVDDLIVYRRSVGYRLVVNAGTADADVEWMVLQGTPFAVRLRERRDLAILAVQGPEALATTDLLFGDAAGDVRELGGFESAESPDGEAWFCARTGYTGEDGFELILPSSDVVATWNRLLEAGVRPCGLGARDTLRLEAGMNLYGQDMTAETSPLESGLAWTVAMGTDRAFIGRGALERQLAEGLRYRQVGLLLEAPGVLRSHMIVKTSNGDGEITSGSYAPTLGRSIALARVPVSCADDVAVDVRGKLLAARVVRPPFVRRGRIQINL